jgi:hypothetical protein
LKNDLKTEKFPGGVTKQKLEAETETIRVVRKN